MKELSSEEKAERYDEAIKRLEDIETGKCPITFMFTEDLFDYLFPELKESGNEKIRKNLITLFKGEYGTNSNARFAGIKVKDIIAWLEEQGVQRQAWSEEDEDTIEKAICVLEANFEPSEGFSELDIKRYQLVDRLKSIKERYTWKPSDEQMEVLVWCKPLFVDPKSKGVLESLIDDLKKLKEE